MKKEESTTMDVPASHSKLVVTNEETGERHPLREYRAVTIGDDDDQLHCLLVRDRSIEKAAISTTIYPAGQLHDGLDWPGRAHLLEHLLFLGSKTFPEENALDSWLTQHGGHSNAYTDLEMTCYYMDFLVDALEGTMERWSAALREPLLSTDVVEREIMAVDSEHAKNKPQDFWRTYQLSKTLLAPPESHPYGQFGSGCLGSLLPSSADSTTKAADTEGKEDADATDTEGKEDADAAKAARIAALRQAVFEFWDLHYTANNVSLAVISSHSLDELEALVKKHFSNLPKKKKDDKMIIPAVPPLPRPSACRRVDYVPIRPVYSLELHFPLREIDTLYLEKPTRVLSHLLGDEGPGSLLHCLRHEQPWVQELTADNSSRSTSSFSIFILSMELTPMGWEHVDEIITLCFAYIKILADFAKDGLPPHVYEELKLMGDMQFDFLGIPSSAADTVSFLSAQMHSYDDPRHYLSGNFRYFANKLDEDSLQNDFIKNMEPENMLIFVGAPDYGQAEEKSEDSSAWQTDTWYGTRYRISTVDAGTIEKWKNPSHELVSHLHLPEPNEFLPSNFELYSLPAETMTKFFDSKESPPVCLQNDHDVQLWYKPDTAFSMPKVNIFVSFPVPSHDPSSSSGRVISALWTEWQNEVANIFAYAASMAGLHGEWVPNSKRSTIELHVSGYSHKAALFCRRLLETTVGSSSSSNGDAPFLDNKLWERLVHKMRDQYQSFIMAEVYQHAIYYLDQCLEAVPTPRTIEQRMLELERLTSADLITFHKKIFLSSKGLQILVHGNLSPQEAKALANEIPQILQRQRTPEIGEGEPVPLLPKRTTLQQRIVQLPSSSNFVLRQKTWNPDNTNNCTLHYYEFGIVDLPTNATISFLRHLIAEPSYNQLRTQEQLGYIVHSQLRTSGDHVKALILLVQGEAKDPVHMDTRIRVFWQTARTLLVDMPEAEFLSHRKALYENFMESKKNLLSESASLWNQITNQTFHYERIREIARHLLEKTKDDVLRVIDKCILYGSSISVQMFGQGVEVPTDTKQDGAVFISDPIEFGCTQALFPLPPVTDVEVVDLVS